MSNYLIKLIPTGKFFFGGDMTFSVGAKERPKNWNNKSEEEKARISKQIDDNTRYSSYIIKSEKFPQQTSVLGMLRFLLLQNTPGLFDKENNKIVAEKTEVAEVIGEHSFRENKGEEIVFGCIKKLSPCFLMNGDTVVTPLPMDYGLETIDLSNSKELAYNDNPIVLGKIVSAIKKGNGKESEVLYSAKTSLYTRYSNKECKPIYDGNEIFIEDQRIGISRNIYTGITEENALFKQINYRLADGFCFAFYANIDIDDIDPYNNKVVSLGADSSQFVIQIKEEEIRDISLPATNVLVKGGYCKVVLTSPTLIDKETVKKSDFAITETIPFKYIKTQIDQKESYHRLSGIQHSEKEELFQTGSVFYFKSKDNATEFITEIEKHKEFCQIGYNYFQKIDLTTN